MSNSSSEYDVHWSHTSPTCTPPTPDSITPLTHSIASLDLLIIGGGYTGLSTARYMKETFPHLRIGIIEKKYCGYGASGRNSGYVNAACIYNHPAELVHTLGPQRASHVASTLRDAVSAIKTTIKQYNIDCDMEETGLAYVAIDSHQSHIATSIHNAAHVIGSQSEYWDHPKCSEQLGSPLIQAATIDPEACQINPYKYCRGILDNIIRPLGIDVWEDTEMIACTYGTINRVTVRSSYGEYIIHTRYIVHATNAYTTDTYLKTSFCPMHVYSIVTEPLTQQQRDAMGWISRTGIYTLHNILTAIRWTSDHRLLVSTGNIAYHSTLHTADTPHQYEYLQHMLQFMYPSTKDIKIVSKWDGVIAINLDDRPIIGVHPKHENVYHALAYCGHGVPLSNYAGTLIRDLFLHQQSCHALHIQPSSLSTSPNIPSPATSLQLPFHTPIRIPIPSASCIRTGIDITYVNYLRWQDRRANKRAAKMNNTIAPLVPYSRPSTLWLLGFTSLLVLEMVVLVKLDIAAWKAIQARFSK